LAGVCARFLHPHWQHNKLLLSAAILAAIVVALPLLRWLFTGSSSFLLERKLRNADHFAWLLILRKTKGPAAFAAVMVALSLSFQLGPISGSVADVLTQLMQVAFIALFTWDAIVTTDIFGSIYLRRSRLDVEDNLLARKHVAQIRILKRAAVAIIALIGIASALMTFDHVRQLGVSLFASAGVAGLAIGLAARLHPLFRGAVVEIRHSARQTIAQQ
jgi:hypothetical protein